MQVSIMRSSRFIGTAALVAFMVLLVSCSEESVPSSTGKTGSKNSNGIFGVTFINNLQDLLDQDPNDFDALMITSITSAGQRHGYSNTEVNITRPNAFFLDKTTGKWVAMSDVRTDGNIMVYDNELWPERYQAGAGWNQNAYQHDQNIMMEFETHAGERVTESLRLPPNFHSMSLSCGTTMSLRDGATLTWDHPQSSADVIINLFSIDETGRGTYISTDIITPDDGSYTFTSDDLNSFGVKPGDLSFHIIRVNIKARDYDNGTRKAAFMTMAEANYVVHVEP